MPGFGGDGSVDGTDVVDADDLAVSLADRLAFRIVTSGVEDAGSLRFLGLSKLDAVEAGGDGGELVEEDAGEFCCTVSKDDDLDAGVPVDVVPRALLPAAGGCRRLRVFDVIGAELGIGLSPSAPTGDLRFAATPLALLVEESFGDDVGENGWKESEETDGDRRLGPLVVPILATFWSMDVGFDTWRRTWAPACFAALACSVIFSNASFSAAAFSAASISAAALRCASFSAAAASASAFLILGSMRLRRYT